MPFSAAASIATIAGAGASIGNIIANGGGPDVSATGSVHPVTAFESPGFRYFNDNSGNVTGLLGPEAGKFLSGMDLSTLTANQGLQGVQDQLTPGFGALTKSVSDVYGRARQRLTDARLAAVSDLKGNLGQRRILGSSFAADTLARTDKEYQRAQQDLDAQEAQFTAAAKLQELGQTVSLIQTRYSNDVANLTSHINQLNFTTDQATALANNGQKIMAGLAQTQADIAARIGIADQQGAGQLLGLSLSQLKGNDFSSLRNLFTSSPPDLGTPAQQSALLQQQPTNI